MVVESHFVWQHPGLGMVYKVSSLPRPDIYSTIQYNCPLIFTKVLAEKTEIFLPMSGKTCIEVYRVQVESKRIVVQVNNNTTNRKVSFILFLFFSLIC